MKKLFLSVLVVCFSLSVAFAGGSKEAAKSVYKLKMAYIPATTNANESPDVMYAKVFKETIEAASSGRVKVDLFGGGQLGNQAEMVQGLSSGAIEIGVINVSMLNNLYKPTMILSVPGLFLSIKECNDIVNGKWGQTFFDGLRTASKIRVLDAGSNGFRHFTNNIREVKTMEDAKGITFRVMENPVSIKMVEAMGARAVPMPGSEMYMAMKTKVVDGQENPILNIIQDKTFEVQKYLTLDGHIASLMTYVMNDTLYSSMPADVQQMVKDASKKAAAAANEVIKIRNEQGLVILQQQGMIISQPTEAALDQWHKVIFDATQSYVRTQIGNEIVDSLMKELAAYRK